MQLEEYRYSVNELISTACNGIDIYATELYDLSGRVLCWIEQIIELTEEAELPSEHNRNIIIDLAEAAYAGAEKYAEDLEDTTDCTEHLDRISDYLKLEEL